MKNTKRKLRLNPSVGMKQFAGRFSFLAIALLAAAYAVLSIRFTNAENAVIGSTGMSTLRSVAAIAMPAGIFIAFLASKFKYEQIKPMYGLIAVAGSLSLFAFLNFTPVISETSSLWRLESVMGFVAVCSCLILVFTLILADLGVRIKPQIGVAVSVCCTIAAALTLIRLVLTVTTLQTAIGDDYNFVLASEEFYSEVSWILRRIPFEKATQSIYTARIIERIGLICLLASGIPFGLNYKNFFETFNREMDFSADLPDGYIEIEHRVRKKKKKQKNSNIDNRFSEMPSRGSNTRIDPNENYYRKEKRGASFDDIFEEKLSAIQNGEETSSSSSSDKARYTPRTERRRSEPVDDGSYVIPEHLPAKPRVTARTSDGRAITVKVKASPSRPSLPKDGDDIWNNYRD
ncbi:MAG: hypothetical protein E7546_01075 [Ruminococcaceae bacterium]|nr:hypothetical protein [Oscillospiraceae bacterium]